MNTLLSGRVVIALVWIHCQDLLMHSSLTKGEEEFNMEDKLVVLTVHQLQGYSKGTPNVTTTSARDTQTLAGQPGQGHTVPCRPVLTATMECFPQ